MEEKKVWFKAVDVAYCAIFAALNYALTMIVRIPFGPGYLNFGDAGIMFAALAFGPVVGAFAGGVGTAIADLIGFPMFAPITLVNKGFEGFVVGFIGHGRGSGRQIIACIVGGVCMIIGYVSSVWYFWGPGAAMMELSIDIVQALVGLVISIPLFKLLIKAYPPLATYHKRSGLEQRK